jgi:hypothetical protein
MLFYMGAKQGLSLEEKNTDWEYLSSRCLVRYLNVRGMKWQEAIKLHNEETGSLYSSPDMKIIKYKMMRWHGHVARMESLEILTEFCLENLKGRTTWKTET